MSADEVDAAMARWQQGDFILGDSWFLWAADPTEAQSEDLSDLTTASLEAEVSGLAVLSQTCDIIRGCEDRPLLEVGALVPAMSARHIEEVRLGMRPRYAYLPGAAAQGLIVDLDRVMSLTKRAAARREPRRGCTDDFEIQLFAESLARKHTRFAFPDDFVDAVKPMLDRISEKHSKQSDEGEALRRFNQIRVLAEPNWSDNKIDITFYFIIPDDIDNTDRVYLDGRLNGWMDLLNLPERYNNASATLVDLSMISAFDYAKSALLDLDRLTNREVRKKKAANVFGPVSLLGGMQW